MSVAADSHQGPWHSFVDLKEKHEIKLKFGLCVGNLTLTSYVMSKVPHHYSPCLFTLSR